MILSSKPATPAASPKANPPALRLVPPVVAVAPTPTSTSPSADEIREYANHLYVQRGSVDGHDRDDWLEAEACLSANIPKESSRTRMHHH